eukprot:SAG25_NODE_1903_length_2164_cov_5.367070_2_plen_126_part_00
MLTGICLLRAAACSCHDISTVVRGGNGVGWCQTIQLSPHAFALGKACTALCNAVVTAVYPGRDAQAASDHGWPNGELDQAVWASDAVGCVRCVLLAPPPPPPPPPQVWTRSDWDSPLQHLLWSPN